MSKDNIEDVEGFPQDLIVLGASRGYILDVIEKSGGCGASFEIKIVSEQFEGKRLLERHRLVNAALAEEMKQIHALSIVKALTLDQWKQDEAKKSQPSA